MNAVMKAGNATDSLGQMLPDTVHMLHGDEVMDMPLAHVQLVVNSVFWLGNRFQRRSN